MANTPNLNLPLIDATATADVPRDMNALANGIDGKVGVAGGLATLGADGKVPASQLSFTQPPDATTTTKGIVKLSSATNSTSETEAATPKAVKTINDGVGDKATLLTTEKGTIVGALNELFTNANSLKSDWAGVIGSPLSNTDTSAQLKSKTQTIKNTLATNLTSKGQSSAGTETLQALVDKVGLINTGKRFASGTVMANGSPSYPQTRISGLSFSPNLIIVRRVGTQEMAMRVVSMPATSTGLSVANPQSPTSGQVGYSVGTVYSDGFSFGTYVTTSGTINTEWFAVE